MAKQTLSNYNATNGDASKIYVKSVADALVKTVGDVDDTARLIAAEILVGLSDSGDAIVETFGSDWADVARYALGVKTNPDSEL